MVIQVQDLVKRYGDFTAVDHLSFEVHSGEIFGLLGPNGAGKTTTIRVIMDILTPDAGSVTVLGHSAGESKSLVGYLPEERGLYRNLKVIDTLVYLAELKGTSHAVARERAEMLLARVQLDEWATCKVKDLSQGMQQRLQFIASIVHDPQLVFLDEPFQGLDPINVERVKALIAEIHREGKTIVLSSHRMNLVEVLCDRVLLVHRGKSVLYGPLEEIKRMYAPNIIRVRADRIPPDLPGVTKIESDDGAFNLRLAESTAPEGVLRALLDHDVDIRAFEVAPAPLEDIFLTVVGEEEVRDELA
ncbi:MAG TPA: ATP-binding cassette domain-containing protein [Chloroflexi bacterium]|nr:ATP-binding cassette domain-containing protein [Chloroflexota bacterium]